MNVRDFVLQRDPDEPVGDLAEAYLKEVLALADEDEKIAALMPAIRQLVSSVASSIRKAQRGPSWTWPRAEWLSGDDEPGPVRNEESSVARVRPPGREPWLAWLRNQADATYWVPATGAKLMLDMTTAEWDRRAEWLENTARGVLAEASRCRDFAALLRQSGVETARELLT